MGNWTSKELVVHLRLMDEFFSNIDVRPILKSRLGWSQDLVIPIVWWICQLKYNVN